MPPCSPRRRRARPVADAPIDALLPRVRDLAKGWLLALVEQAPLQHAPSVLGAGIAAEGPRLCDAVLRALADDLELRRLEPDGPLGGLASRVGELAGAGEDAVTIVRAIDALGGVLWTALRRELAGEDDPELISDLAERLALVCGLLRVAALGRLSTLGEVAGPGEAAPEPCGADSEPEISAPPRSPSAEALWVGALENEIHRAGASSLSLLLAELEDAERMTASEGAAGVTAAFDRFAQALRGVVRPQDILVSETASRAWIIARDTARPDAHALGLRVAEAVGAGTGWRGAPLVATVGLAVLGEDGRTSAELIDAAEESRFAASASGTDVAR